MVTGCYLRGGQQLALARSRKPCIVNDLAPTKVKGYFLSLSLFVCHRRLRSGYVEQDFDLADQVL